MQKPFSTMAMIDAYYIYRLSIIKLENKPIAVLWKDRIAAKKKPKLLLKIKTYNSWKPQKLNNKQTKKKRK